MSFILDGMTQAFGLLMDGNPETWSAVYATVAVTTMSVAASVILGAPLGFLLGYCSFPGKRALRMLADTLLSFPTVVIGLIVYALLSSRGPLGGAGLLFTLPGVAIGQTLLGLPMVIALTANAVEYADTRLRDTLLTLGASGGQVLRAMLWEVRYHLLLAAVAAYGRIVSEVGISMMVGGNIKWHTRTITTAIALETGKGEFAMGIALGVVLMVIAFLVNLSLSGLKRRAVIR
ncbi:ABC-type transporter, integral membrane subunit [Oleidesulfovibrio alaskensis G20]|jgi:tungstate transport system permease protein|uniref:ABC-type transporter, integral membrane subunit n=1 Tax=Oleidesulfovibrio alaskensis (strain ATCC BAA-1058 / DSM 17464 / G20) TaxID=207559 RepID=Q316W2_OLEA2|nr:ABC transporter permease [Oleidesulfovibrio alaskensis]ABB37034.1 ABC-type transporter, integral membrane subunit [Oleidesulfovibrio alaskensis G20]MBG0773020.1 ABC transporter permease [Oleidesulfovibrio alaskensis]MBL3582848.1 ABC transporter permease [Oleidesulfovibrio alaskensis]